MIVGVTIDGQYTENSADDSDRNPQPAPVPNDEDYVAQRGAVVYDCYHLQKDTVGCSDHCPVVLVVKLM